MIQVYLTLPADDSNVLSTANSALKKAPADGQYRIWAGSDQVDGELTIKVGTVTVLEKSAMRLITVGILPKDDQPLAKFNAQKGEDVVINYNEVTAGTATIFIQFLDLVDLMLEAGYTPDQVAQILAG